MAKVRRYSKTKGGGVGEQVDLNTGKALQKAPTNQHVSQTYTDTSAQQAADTGSFADGVPLRNYQQINEAGYNESEGGYVEPAVVSNVQILEDLIPQMNSRMASLPGGNSTYGADMGPGDSTGFGGEEEDYTADDIFGISKKKKKKNPWEQYSQREGTNMALPVGYWEGMYGENASEFKLLAEMERTNNDATREAIRAIKGDFNQRKAQQEDINKTAENQIKQALLTAGGDTGGSSRYAPLSSAGLISAQESYGLQNLAKLDEQERIAVAEARAAQKAGDYELMQKKLDLFDSIQEEKTGAIGTVREAQEQVARDSAIAGLISQGVTDPLEMLDALNYSAGGELIGDYTLEEITEKLSKLKDYIGTGSFSFSEKQLPALIGAGLTMLDIKGIQEDLSKNASIDEILGPGSGFDPEQAQAIKQALGITTASTAGLTPGVGAETPEDEFIIRTRMFPKFAAILNKGTLSDADRVIIDDAITNFRSMGLSEQQAVDKIWGFPTDSPYNSYFQDAILAGSENGEDVSFAVQKVANMMARGSYIPAMNEVENQAMSRAETLAGNSYFGKVAADAYTTKIDRIKQLMKEGGIVGVVSGTFNNLLGKIKGPKAATIKAELTDLYTQIRKENAGVSVTDSETKWLSPLLAGISDTDENFMAKLDVLQRGVLDRHNATRRSVSLPSVTVQGILDPNERLKSYISTPVFTGETAPQL